MTKYNVSLHILSKSPIETINLKDIVNDGYILDKDGSILANPIRFFRMENGTQFEVPVNEVAVEFSKERHEILVKMAEGEKK